MELRTHEVMWLRDGVSGDSRVIGYKVFGLPPDQEARIANFGGRNKESWRILRRKDGVSGGWTGNYVSIDDALRAVSEKLL